MGSGVQEPPPAQPLPPREWGLGGLDGATAAVPPSSTPRSWEELIFAKTRSLQRFYLETQNLGHQTI